MFEKLYLVDQKQLEKIQESPAPFLSYSDIYEAIVNTKAEESTKISRKKVITTWLEIKKQ